MLLKLRSDREFLLLTNKTGYILNVDFPNKAIMLHRTSCKYCNPNEEWGIQVENKIYYQTGETWFSDTREDAQNKVEEIIRNKGYVYSSCRICNP